MTPTIIADGLHPSRAAIALLQAGHLDAAADVLVAAGRMAEPTVELAAVGGELRVRVQDRRSPSDVLVARSPMTEAEVTP